MTKRCSKCKQEKDIIEFSKDNSRKDGLQCSCKLCLKQYTIKHNDQIRLYRSSYYQLNQNNIKEKSIVYYHKTKEIRKEKRKEYNRRPEVKRHRNEMKIWRKQNDPNYKIGLLIRSRIRRVMKGISKADRSLNLLGCSVEQLKQHLQETAIKNGYTDFDINNYDTSQFHIDHVIPCESFNLVNEDQQRRCFHYSNLQILTAKENLEKNKYEI